MGTFVVNMEALQEVLSNKYEELNKLIPKVIEIIQEEASKSETCLLNGLKNLQNNLNEAIPSAKEVAGFACLYDFNEKIKGNGYRSYVKVFILSINCVIQECEDVRHKSHLISFNNTMHIRNIESWIGVFGAFSLIFRMLVKIHKHSTTGCLIPTDKEQLELIQNLDPTIKLDVTSFYGNISGFQFIPSVRPFISGWCTMLTVFSEMSSVGVVNNTYTPAFINVMKYLFDKDARAKRVVALSSQGTFSFFTNLLSIGDHLADNINVSLLPIQSIYKMVGSKVFMGLERFLVVSSISLLQGFVTNVCSLAHPKVAVNIHVSLPPVTVELAAQDGGRISVTPPSAHMGLRPIDCRLLCARLRQGMMGDGRNHSHSSPSKGLLIYYHGGGFCVTTSKNYEVYLKVWANKLDVPIFCVDYTLAPEARYPRQLEECFYAYCWALENAHLLGTTADNICVSGDSAGGNLAMGVVLKCIQHGVRLPSGLFLAYTAFIVEMTLSPGRLLSVIDPIIPFGFLVKCFEAYLGDTGGKVPKFLNDLIYVEQEELKHMKTLPCTLSSKSYTKNEEDSSLITDDGMEWKSVAGRTVQAAMRYVTSFLPPTSRRMITDKPGSDPNAAYAFHKDLNGKNRFEEFENMTVTTCMAGSTAVKDFHDSSISPDYYLSPYYAPLEMLSQLPRISLMTTDLDTCLDDNVVFARKLRNSGVDVELDIREGLPHGFLLMASASKDARRASQKAIAIIRDILGK